MSDKETLLIRIHSLQEDVSKVLAANAANSAYIDRYVTRIKERLEVLEEDIEKFSEKYLH